MKQLYEVQSGRPGVIVLPSTSKRFISNVSKLGATYGEVDTVGGQIDENC